MARGKKEEVMKDGWNWHKWSGVKKIEIGFILFVFGGVFWIGDFFAWLWFQSLTVVGLVLVATGALKLYAGGTKWEM